MGFDGTNWLVAWAEESSGGTDVIAARLDMQGVLLDADPLTVAAGTSDTWFAAVSGGPGGWLVAFEWSDLQNGVRRVGGSRISSAGAVLDSPAGRAAVTRRPRRKSP